MLKSCSFKGFARGRGIGVAIVVSLMSLQLLSCDSAPSEGDLNSDEGKTSALVRGKASAELQGIAVTLIVPVSKTQSEICSGVVMAPGVILTAAHCFDPIATAEDFALTGIRVAETRLEDAGAELHPVGAGQSVQIHPRYKEDPRRFDLAILKVVAKAGYVWKTGLSLADAEWLPSQGDQLLLTGAGVKDGYLEAPAKPSVMEMGAFQGEVRVDRKGRFSIVQSMLSSALQPGDLLEMNAGDASPWLCAGDSGGALLSRADGQFVLLGVNARSQQISFQGKTLCLSSKMVVTPIAPHLDWIEKNR